MEYVIKPLSRQEVIKAIEFGRPSRIPMVFTRWWGGGLGEQYGDRLREFDKYPEDVVVIGFPCPSNTAAENGFYWKLPNLTVEQTKKIGIDTMSSLPDWSYLEDMLNNPPNTDAPGLFADAAKIAEQARRDGKYVLIMHWGLMFERIWGFRGMQNLLEDYILEPKNVHKLHKLVADTEQKLLSRAIEEVKPDGYMHSDDLGGQQALMMGPAHFREFIAPYYKQVWSTARKAGVHVWLHTCGNVQEIIGDLIDCGLNVLHPIQKHTMDWNEVAAKWKGKIVFWVGMDVQHLLVEGTPDEVREEVRQMVKIFNSPEGGMIFASGNGIVGGTPFENIDAYLDECCKGL